MSSEEPSSFASFELDDRLASAVADLGFENATPIQAAAIPALLTGVDVIGRARTGSGKTAAFGLPLLEKVKEGGKKVRAVVLAPTRELAIQVTQAIKSYGAHLPQVRMLTIYGGASFQAQAAALRRGVSVVVGTPGRVLDHLNRGTLDLSNVEVFVLDEGDEMLRMGFIDDVEAILSATPQERQVALFSASMPDRIRKIATRYMNDPQIVQVESKALTVDHIKQYWMLVPQRHKLDALERLLAVHEGTKLVFARTRRGCAEVADALAKRGMAVDALHGDLNQSARERVLQRLRAKSLGVVIATDVAARGIDVEHIAMVINLDLPEEYETYVHRIGRTGRAGRSGVAISLSTPKQKRFIRDLARTLKVDIEAMDVPSDRAIGMQRRGLLRTALEGALEHPDIDAAHALMDEILEGSEVRRRDLAAAAIALLAGDRKIRLATAVDEAPPNWARPTSSFGRGQGDGPRRDAPPRPNWDNVDMVELFLPIGRRDNVRAGDLVGAIANEADIPGNAIGRIQIFDNKSFVGLPRELAERVLHQFSEIAVRGRSVPISVSKQRDQDFSGPRPQKRAPNQRNKWGKGGGRRPGGFKPGKWRR